MSQDFCRLGATWPIRVYMFDGENTFTGESPVVVIERLSDGKFWDGNSWESAQTELAMSDLSDGTDHLDGVYEYQFTDDASTSPQEYEWSVYHEATGSYRRCWRGRLVGTDDLHGLTTALTEPSGVYGSTPTALEILAWLGLVCRDQVEVTSASLVFKNDAGSQVASSSLSDNGTTFTRAKVT